MIHAKITAAVGFVIAAFPLYAQEFQVQTIEGFDRTVFLNSIKPGPNAHTWWAQEEAVDPAQEAKRLLSGKAGRRDQPGGNWKPVKVPANLYGQPGFSSKISEAWYIKVFDLRSPPTVHVSFRLGEIMDRDIAYLNGKEIAHTGDWNSHQAQGYDKHRIYEVPDELWRPGRNVLIIRTQGYFPGEIGIYRNTTEIGSSESIHREYFMTDFIAALFLMTYLTAGGYFLFLFMRRRAERENLFFGLFTTLLVAYQFLRTQMKYETGLDFVTMKRIEYLILYSVMTPFYYFLRYTFRLPKSTFVIRMDRLMYLPFAGVAALIGYTLITPSPVQWSNANRLFLQYMIWPFYLSVSVGILVYRIRNSDRDAVFMISGISIMIVGLVIDILSNYGVINIPRVMGYAFAMFVLSLALILANRFVRLNEEVEDLNRNLETKVHERTQQLQRSLEDVRALKVQQDGDYFLTSLLIAPLGGNFTQSQTVSTEILVRQKKTFQFKRWSAEIGGDLCVAQSIKLRGRTYTVFLNGDAMGKSIQGAGGALVLGTVFKAILTRTEMSESASERYPEQWLKECFAELQNVFVSFDGYMMVSAVIGLVDDERGTLYFVNAEHPWLVLYRSGTAAFIENELVLRKFGMTVLERGLQIRIFPMKPGDVIICGSDGRDDILLGVDSGGRRIINEDEFQFLRTVEQADGILENIEKSLRHGGELTDDLSMIRIAYREDAPVSALILPAAFAARVETARGLMRDGDDTGAVAEFERAYELYAEDPEVVRDLSQIYLRLKNYARAAHFCERYTEMVPQNSEFLFASAFALKQAAGTNASLLAKAVEFGERCRLREPGHIRNLVNLADAYRLLGNSGRAQTMARHALALDPENERAKRVAEAIKGAGGNGFAL